MVSVSLRRGVERRWAQVGLVTGLTAATLLVHPVEEILSHPFWSDEAWVAVGTRAPLDALPRVAFPSPFGWALLLRLPWPGEQGMRLLPLAFSAAAVVVAYLFASGLGWKTRSQGLLVGGVTGLAVLLAPWALVRNDLKHYTADAFAALLILWLGSRVEADWSAKRLMQLCVGGVALALLSWVSMVVSMSVLVALLGLATVRRNSRAIRRIVITGISMGALFLLIGVTLVIPYVRQPLQDFWAPYYLDGTVGEMWIQALAQIQAAMSVGPPQLAVVAPILFLGGILAAHRRRPGTSIAIVTICMVALVLGVSDLYPFFATRTSHFLIMMGVAVGGVGVGALIAYLWDRTPKPGMIALTAVVLGIVLGAIPHLNRLNIPDQDVRSQVRHVQANRATGDVVLVNALGQFGLSYYWEGGELDFESSEGTLFSTGFTVRVEGDGPLVVAAGRTEVEVERAVTEAHRLALAEGGTGRIWIMLSHVRGSEPETWRRSLKKLGLSHQELRVGPEPLWVTDVPSETPAAPIP